ncbi:MAG TPA: ABC transporter substrate-binding protein, partial [Actinomycetota bacterium]|nr:ABC transporter substrate-binding protein [Actinomycetota bacterium]
MRRINLLVLALLLCAACTGGTAPAPSPSVPAPTPPAPSAAPLRLDVVAAATGPAAADDRSYLDGMRLAVEDVNAAGGVAGRPVELRVTDTGGEPERGQEVLRSIEEGRPVATLFVGPGPTVAEARASIVAAGNPVFLLGGDLYTSGRLFDQVFQTSIPWEWQAHVIARYLVRDRKAKDVVFVGSGPEAARAATATADAMSYWGGHLARSYVGAAPPGSLPATAEQADAAVVFGSPGDSAAIVRSLTSSGPGPRVAGGQSLLADSEAPPPGTTACYTYTWAGWAEPIPRVGRFIHHVTQAFGHPPVGFGQEGYDAVRVLALALERTEGRGGNALVTALETTHKTFSSFPVDLGPDDHLFLPRDELGLFAVPGPTEKL